MGWRGWVERGTGKTSRGVVVYVCDRDERERGPTRSDEGRRGSTRVDEEDEEEEEKKEEVTIE